ncbi:aminodeoxychorismate synthase component 1 [mine drainage metagenome]|uniref:aminodeoxychorismate synthase n=1 Tax=mine drainage metagenome TaxID=410659 RepID=A0A1J5RAC5_9ZZZZ
MADIACVHVPCELPPERVLGPLAGRTGSFLLDGASDLGGQGRYSILGFDPFLVIRTDRLGTTLEEEGEVRLETGDPLEILRRELRRFRSAGVDGLPFAGGAVGGLAYEFGSRLERIPRLDGPAAGFPDMYWAFYDGVMVFERGVPGVRCVANPVHRRSAGEILERLRAAIGAAHAEEVRADAVADERPGEPVANFSRSDYERAVAAVRERIATGEVYQVNLSQRFDLPMSGDAYALYLRLRKLSPAPFACFLNGGDWQVASSSPERFLRLQGRRVETRPIKGTRRRGSDVLDDRRLRDELWNSAKDRAELLMIVDLERNDLGRVCEIGSVRVDELYGLESHPTVHHLVATVSGALRSGLDVVDCLRATFPGGSITGAPKISAQRVIAELERCARGIYTGSLGYIGFDGDADLNVAIRTIVCGGGCASFHVGGGVVWDSDPALEYEETLVKGRAMHAALTGNQ